MFWAPKPIALPASDWPTASRYTLGGQTASSTSGNFFAPAATPLASSTACWRLRFIFQLPAMKNRLTLFALLLGYRRIAFPVRPVEKETRRGRPMFLTRLARHRHRPCRRRGAFNAGNLFAEQRRQSPN